MRGRLYLALVAAALFVTQALAGPSALTTARLEIGSGTCSGTIVAPSTILSAAHCFKDEDPLAELFGKGPAPLPTEMLVDGYKVYIETIVFDGADHALVKVIFVFKDHATLARTPPVGSRVHLWGNPDGIMNVYREGYITSYSHGEMLMDLNGFFGDSGSGIFDEDGNLVGVVSYLNAPRYHGMVFKLMGAYPLEFTALQYSMAGVAAP